MSRLVIDPVTRIGGRLRIEVDVAGGAVREAWSSGTMFRGIERILEGRDPRDAWLLAQRVCGTCGGSHALASVRAVENAIGARPPRNARLLRNLLAGSLFVRDHVAGFYHRQSLDWVDVAAAVRADPSAASRLARSRSDWAKSSPAHMADARDRLAKVMSKPGGPFANGSWGHPAYALSPEANLVVLAHYLEALDWSRRFMRLHALIGGKDPHGQAFLVGGMTVVPPWGGPTRAVQGEHPKQVDRNSPAPLSARGLGDIATLIGEARTFVASVYLPDVVALVHAYAEKGTAEGASTGAPARGGVAGASYLSYGEFPEDDSADPVLFLPRGRVAGGNLAAKGKVDAAAITESVAASWYSDAAPPAAGRSPAEGRTDPDYTGPTPPYSTLEGADGYSWLKAPRYDGEPMEVGPLARLLVAYSEGRLEVRRAVDETLGELGFGPDGLRGTVGRTVARAIEARVVADRLDRWHKDLVANLATGDLAVADITAWDPATWPGEAHGSSLGETPRGSVGHWVTTKGHAVDRYQIVDGTTWNASPRDAAGVAGPLEAALVGTPVADPAQPVEILRTVHSFDPCAACAVHAWSGNAVGEVVVDVLGGDQ